jgi:hypothetical protein
MCECAVLHMTRVRAMYPSLHVFDASSDLYLCCLGRSGGSRVLRCIVKVARPMCESMCGLALVKRE